MLLLLTVVVEMPLFICIFLLGLTSLLGQCFTVSTKVAVLVDIKIRNPMDCLNLKFRKVVW